MTDNNLTIQIKQRVLSDGSKVYDAVITHVELNAVTEDDAVALADRIVEAVRIHTLNDAHIRYAY
jgi:hypothetical protein